MTRPNYSMNCLKQIYNKIEKVVVAFKYRNKRFVLKLLIWIKICGTFIAIFRKNLGN